jgi:hypothetical protein
MDLYAIRVSSEEHQRYKVGVGNGRQIPDDPYTYRQNAPHVSLGFAINKFGVETGIYRWRQRSERFLIPIEPEAFADLAHAMMKADPQAAIRAFGEAMREFEISSPDVNRAE